MRSRARPGRIRRSNQGEARRRESANVLSLWMSESPATTICSALARQLGVAEIKVRNKIQRMLVEMRKQQQEAAAPLGGVSVPPTSGRPRDGRQMARIHQSDQPEQMDLARFHDRQPSASRPPPPSIPLPPLSVATGDGRPPSQEQQQGQMLVLPPSLNQQTDRVQPLQIRYSGQQQGQHHESHETPLRSQIQRILSAVGGEGTVDEVRGSNSPFICRHLLCFKSCDRR